jgi:hypothetical protein
MPSVPIPCDLMIDSFFPAFFGLRNQEGLKVSNGSAILSQNCEFYCTLSIFPLSVTTLSPAIF